nr:putative feruloyl esterase a [Quercus suber]
MFSKLLLAGSLASIVAASSPTAVSSSVYDNISHYTAYAGAAYAEDCPTLPFGSSILASFNYSSTDTKVNIYREDSTNTVIVAFRGSAFPRNLDQDFAFSPVPLNLPGASCSGCMVHSGFQQLYSAMANDVTTAVKKAKAAHPFASVIVTGHSLGGALASLSSASLVGQGIPVITYTYGEPRNGNAAFANYINFWVPFYLRTTHYNDGVPQIPPTILGFQHHGTEYWESKQTGNNAASTFRCAGTEPTNCNAAQNPGPNPINGAHIQYSNTVLAGVLFNPYCGYKAPSPK